MATPIGGEIQVGGGARVGGKITRLEREREDTYVDVVSLNSQDSFWRHLETCGRTLPISHEVLRRRFIAELETEEDIYEEEFSEDSVDHVIESDTDRSDIDRMNLRVQKWIGDRTVVIDLPATIVPVHEPSNGDSSPVPMGTLALFQSSILRDC